MIHSALNETCNGMRIDKFEARIGYTREEYRSLMKRKTRGLKGKTGQNKTLNLKNDEAIMISKALDETCNGLDAREFHTRTGYYKEEMQAFLSEFRQLLKRIKN